MTSDLLIPKIYYAAYIARIIYFEIYLIYIYISSILQIPNIHDLEIYRPSHKLFFSNISPELFIQQTFPKFKLLNELSLFVFSPNRFFNI